MQRAVCAVLLVATCGGITFREEPVDVVSSKSHSLLVRAPRGHFTSVSPQFPSQFSPQFPPSFVTRSMHIGRGRGPVCGAHEAGVSLIRGTGLPLVPAGIPASLPAEHLFWNSRGASRARATCRPRYAFPPCRAPTLGSGLALPSGLLPAIPATHVHRTFRVARQRHLTTRFPDPHLPFPKGIPGFAPHAPVRHRRGRNDRQQRRDDPRKYRGTVRQNAQAPSHCANEPRRAEKELPREALHLLSRDRREREGPRRAFRRRSVAPRHQARLLELGGRCRRRGLHEAPRNARG